MQRLILMLFCSLCSAVSPLSAAPEPEGDASLTPPAAHQVDFEWADGPGAPVGRAETVIDVPAEEIRIGSLLPKVGGVDLDARAMGLNDGRVSLITLEDFTLRAGRSVDGGLTFGNEVEIAGRPGDPDVWGFQSCLAPDGTVYVACVTGHPGLLRGLQFLRGDDVGSSWTAPTDIVQPGNPLKGVVSSARSIGISGVSGGTVALAFVDTLSSNVNVTVSTDYGLTWTTPIQVGSGPSSVGVATNVALKVDPTSTIHVAYDQPKSGIGQTVHYVRSTDGGLTFSTEINFDAILSGGRSASVYPDIGIASDNSLLIAFWDSSGPDRIYVVRSTDGGHTFSLSYQFDLNGSNKAIEPRLFPSSVDATVLLSAIESSGTLRVHRSGDYGASFGSAQVISTSAFFVSLTLTRGKWRMARSASGIWGIVWEDLSNDTYTGTLADLYLSVSNDDGVSWSAQARVESDPPGFSDSRVVDLLEAATDEFWVVYRDGNDDNNRSRNVRANRTGVSPIAFGADYRVDQDGGLANVVSVSDMFLTTDGNGRIYAAFTAFGLGPYTDIYVAASLDGGRTFQTPVRASGPAGAQTTQQPKLAATADGFVYLTYQTDDPGGAGREVRLTSSADYGATWLAQDHLLGVKSPNLIIYGADTSPYPQVATVPGGKAWVAWSDKKSVYVSRTTDGGQNVITDEVDQNPANQLGESPRICAQGNQVVLTFIDRESAGTSAPMIYGTVSDDGGVTWSPRVELPNPSLGEYTAFSTDLSCDGTNQALAVYTYSGSGITLFSNRYDGTTWQPKVEVPTTPLRQNQYPFIARTSGNDLLVVYQSQGNVQISRSTDAGATFSPYELIFDSASSQPVPRVVSDGAGNVWVGWLDLGDVLVRHSADGGLTFGPERRLNRETPGTRGGGWFLVFANPAVAVPGAALFGWAAARDTFNVDFILNAWDVNDFDRDTVASGVDCDDNDPLVFAHPGEVLGVSAEYLTAAVRISWVSQSGAAGPATVYEVVTDSLSSIRGSGDYGSAACLGDDLASASFDDSRLDPPPGDGYIYLVRGTNSCGAGTFGDSGIVPDPRDALDAGVPCP